MKNLVFKYFRLHNIKHFFLEKCIDRIHFVYIYYVYDTGYASQSPQKLTEILPQCPM